MANIFGYNQLFSTEPEIWLVDGYIGIGSDGYTAITSPLPKEILDLTHNGTGDFTLHLKHCWYTLLHADIRTEIPGTDTPAIVQVQLDSDNVGAAGTLDGQQGVRFRLSVPSTGAATNLGAHSGLRLLLVLKRSSA